MGTWRPTREESFIIFGDLPSYSLYARHVDDLVLRNVRFRPRQPDIRPPFAFVDLKGPDRDEH